MLFKNHDDNCPIINDIRLKPVKGQINQIGLDPEIILLPNKVSPFICRN